MDDLERRLREDAADIRAEVSKPLAKRLTAAIAAEQRAGSEAVRRRLSSWWLSGLTGVAAAAVTIVVMNLRAPPSSDVPEMATADTRTVPPSDASQQSDFPLRAESAVLMEPLEEELEHLKSDLEKARESVAEDLNIAF